MFAHLKKKIILGTALILALPLALAQSLTLNVPLAVQEHSEWCWSASSKAVINYYKTPPTQCAIANWAYGLNYACGNTNFDWNSPANQPNSLYGTSGSAQNILSHWGVSTTAYASASSWNSVVSDIKAGKPFLIRFGWTAGGGHILAGNGYQISNGSNYVIYMNPWPGEGNSEDLYSWVVSAPDHKWTHTLRGK
jgi:hypothetical protein